MPSLRNLEDDGAVIGYRPKLEYDKQLNVNPEAGNNGRASGNTDDIIQEQKNNGQYSHALLDFEQFSPARTLEVLDMSISTIKDTINSISKFFTGGYGGDYGEISSLLSAFNGNNMDYAMKFIDWHFNQISGSHVPEIIGELYKTSQRLEDISSTMKKLFYGNENISTEEATEKDAATLKAMKEYESSGNIQKINYVSVAYDSMLSRSVMVYGYDVNKNTVDFRDILLDRQDHCVNPSKAADVIHLFEEVNDELSYRKHAYDEQQSLEIMRQTLYNYYHKRSDLMKLYDFFSENSDSLLFGTRISKKQADMRHAIEEVAKTCFGNKQYMSEITDLEREKHCLRDIYAGFNYNSSK